MSEETIFTRIVNGEEAGQEVPRVHWHIIPRFAGDGAAAVYATFDGVDLDEDEMQAVAEDIRDARQVMLRPIGPLVLSRFLPII